MGKEKLEGKANEAETVARATSREKAEAAANETEAAEAAKKREENMTKPHNHNMRCRHISAILRQSRNKENANALHDENQKLKMQIRRIQSEKTASPPNTERPSI